MQIMRWLPILVLLSLPLFVLAQNADDAAKENQRRQSLLVAQLLADIPNLKLGENRAVAYAKVGNLIWKNDQKLARAMFQDAVNELINAQMLAESNQKRPTYQNELLTGGSARPQILNTIASRDAEFALALLIKTRPAAIVKALSIPAGKSTKISYSAANFGYLAQNEFNMEQSFVRMAADQSPERAVKFLKESLKKGFSNETLNLLKKLHEKERETAAGLASEISDKLISSKFTTDNQPNYQNLQIAIAFLTDFIRERNPTDNTFKLDDSQMRKLADKLFSYYLDEGGRDGYYLSHSIIQIAEKLSPSSVEQLKKVVKNSSRHGLYSNYDPDLQKMLNSDATGDQLLAEAKKYPLDSRRQIYQTAANKFLQQGDAGRAADVLNENFSDDALDDALRNLNWQHSGNLIASGKFAEAERLIDEFPENSRHYPLINLANAIYQKDRVENSSYALAVLGKARSLIAEKPENASEMGNLMQVIAAYANIEPTEAFRMYEPLIAQMNELSEAAIVVNGFQGGSNVREGEFLMAQGHSYGFYGADFSVLRTFAGNDFERTTRLIDAFTRREMRISLKIQLAEGF
ncbi:MAG: hypothetical protein H7070_04835 [Saprospiraceae bacterium]|nr:hypothetical protein [Pyrinomonadaceae bacterium]